MKNFFAFFIIACLVMACNVEPKGKENPPAVTERTPPPPPESPIEKAQGKHEFKGKVGDLESTISFTVKGSDFNGVLQNEEGSFILQGNKPNFDDNKITLTATKDDVEVAEVSVDFTSDDLKGNWTPKDGSEAKDFIFKKITK